MPVHHTGQVAIFCMLLTHHTCWLLHTALQPMPDIQPLSYWYPRHSSNLYPSTQCVSSQYSKSLFVGSRGPGNPIHLTHCVCSSNCMVQYTVVSLCDNCYDHHFCMFHFSLYISFLLYSCFIPAPCFFTSNFHLLYLRLRTSLKHHVQP